MHNIELKIILIDRKSNILNCFKDIDDYSKLENISIIDTDIKLAYGKIGKRSC